MKNFIKKIIVRIINIRKRVVLRKKINIIYKNVIEKESNHSKIEIDYQHLELWKELSRRINFKWYNTYSTLTGMADPNYIPENIYYLTIEPTLNKKPFYKSYSDKNFYDLFYEGEMFPKTLLRRINNNYFDPLYIPVNIDSKVLKDLMGIAKRIILKPSIDSGGGENVILMNRNNGEFEDNYGNKLTVDLLDKFSSDFVLQPYIEQHDYYKKFNKTSVNTVRILTYRDVKTEEIHILQSVLRIGKQGSYVDNQASGGIACGVDNKGRLRSFAVDKTGNKYVEYSGIKFIEAGKLFKYEEMCGIARDIAIKNYYFRLLSFDFCVDSNGKVILIEINNMNHEINFYQMTNGPLFNQYTKDVINYCKRNKLTVSFDYSI